MAYTHFGAERGAGGVVQAHPLSSDHTDGDEAQLAIDLILKAQKSMEDPSIAVLARARKHLEALAQALVKRGIEFEAVQIDALETRPGGARPDGHHPCAAPPGRPRGLDGAFAQPLVRPRRLAIA